MELRFPSRVSLPFTVAYAAVMLALQQVEHTSLAFSLLYFLFVILSAVAFNLCDGMNRPSGSYVAWFALLTVILAVTFKAVLGEPADGNMVEPLVTMAVYDCGMLMMLVTVLLRNRLIGPTRGLAYVLGAQNVNLTFSAAGCMLVGVGIILINEFANFSGSGSIMSALNQVNAFLPLGVILATVDAVQKSGGRRSVSVLSLACSLAMFLMGMVGFSKQAMFTPAVAWLIGVTYAHLRLRLVHVVTFGAFGILLWAVFTPLAQLGRGMVVEGSSLADRFHIAEGLLLNVPEMRATYREGAEDRAENVPRQPYFNHSLGLGNRLAILQVDDGLISWTDSNAPLGYAPVGLYVRNWIPHFLDPNKGGENSLYGGNYYAHLIGGYLAPDDYTTGISFGFLGECYIMGRWEGIFFMAPLLWLLLFASVDLISGSLRSSPWGLLPMLLFAHMAPESLVSGVIYFLWYTNIALVLGIWFCVTAAPVMGSVFGTAVLRRQQMHRLTESASGGPLLGDTA